MKFWQLTSVLRGEERIIAAAARQDADWAKFGDWLADLHGIVRDQERDKLDFELPAAFVRAVLGQSGQRYFVSPNGYLRYHRRRDDDQAVTALEAFDRYGGTALEEAQEYGSWPITAGLHREPEWAPPETAPEPDRTEAVQPVRDAVEPAVAAPVQTDAAGGEPQMDDSPQADSQGADSETDSEAWETAEPAEPADWPLRPLILGGIGLAAGLAFYLLTRDPWFFQYQMPALLTAELTALLVGAGMLGFTLERRFWWASLAFAIGTAAVAGGIVYWSGSPNGTEGWRMLSLFLALAIAAPLFQAARDEGGLRFPYASVHDHAWTNVVLWFACWLFVGIVFLLFWLLSALFGLIKIEFLSELMRKHWFVCALTGLSFGGALGLLRETDAVVRLLQRVVATVLAVLSPVLGIGLLLFLVALPFTGLQALWDATTAATPLLLACVIGSLILANAVIGNMAEHESKLPPLRWGAMALALAMLPLAVLAAVAAGLRIGQYGFTPERLWGLTFIVIACAYGLAYLVSLVRGRQGWAAYVRPANLNLAFGLCALGLVLATPLISFNAISTRDQVARLESGKLTVEKFDWRALAFDFGQPGKDALKKFQRSANAQIKAKADEAAKAQSRWDVGRVEDRAEDLTKRLRVLPAGTALPAGLIDSIEPYRCPADEKCTLYVVGAVEVLFLQDACFEPSERKRMVVNCASPARYVLKDGKWDSSPYSQSSNPDEAKLDAMAAALKAGKVEIRTVPRRQAFIGETPVGEPFE